ncbi:MAG: rhodanese-like domain-containing protein [Cyclobacteriaceae bacterium]|nr:rhodanese-like domain-containing protein [Cyclobacteriaceae bacterium]
MTRYILLFAGLSLLSISVFSQQKEEFLCQPCGLPCDTKVSELGGVCPACQMPMVPKSSVKFVNLTPKEFCARIAANPDVVILDVRSPGEFEGTTSSVETYGRFRKAINVNVNQLSKRLEELKKYKDKEILVYCSQSFRSPRAAYYLNMQGFDKVKNMSGGLSKAGDLFKSACFKEHFEVHKK